MLHRIHNIIKTLKVNMEKNFLLILFFVVFFGAQFVYFENRLSDQKEINKTQL